jgi:hypothetical protein
LFGGAAAWALHQQAGMILASWSCANAPQGIWISAGLAFLVLFFGAALSWHFLRAGSTSPSGAGQPHRFLAKIALMAGALFFFAIILQASAALFLPGCAG